MQVIIASNELNSKPQLVLIYDALTKPPRATKPIAAFVDHPSEKNTTVIVTPLEKFRETASLLISRSMSTIIDKKVAVRVTKGTESPYSIRMNSKIAEFSEVTPEQSQYIKPVDMAILSMIPEGYSNLTTYLNERLRANTPEQQNKTFCFHYPGSPDKPEDHTTIKTRILRELLEPEEKEKLNTQDDTESRKNFLERFDWTASLLKEAEK